MEQALKAKTLDNAEQGCFLLTTPDVCPRCHKSVHPKTRYASVSADQKTVQAIFQCTSQACAEIFIANYVQVGSRMGVYTYSLRSVAPLKAKRSSFPETVGGVSPSFIDIHDQALAAETHQLSQLVGIGLRKALEFLIKDFSVHCHPGEAEQIRGMTLSGCIEKFVSDVNIRECAKRAVWLGNDETHYVRKWEEKDISDLKLLVRLTTNWIDNDLLTKRYVAEMRPGGA